MTGRGRVIQMRSTVSQSVSVPSCLAGEPAVPDEHLQVSAPLAPGTGPIHLPGPATVHRKQAHQQESECEFIWSIFCVFVNADQYYGKFLQCMRGCLLVASLLKSRTYSAHIV